MQLQECDVYTKLQELQSEDSKFGISTNKCKFIFHQHAVYKKYSFFSFEIAEQSSLSSVLEHISKKNYYTQFEINNIYYI